MSDNNDAGGKEGCDGAQQPLPELQRANDEGLTAQIMAARMAKDVAQRLPPSVAEDTMNALAEEEDAAAEQNINQVGVLGCRYPMLRRHLFINRLIIFFPFPLQPLASRMDYRTATMRLHVHPFSPM